MSVKSYTGGGGAIVRCGYLKKLKTSKKKWFVLRDETCDTSARLEYYDSEKKFNNGQHPKRSIPLKTCFNINKRSDTKHKHVIALYTKDDCFCVVLESDDELESWLKALLSLQHGEEIAEGETPRPTFEHVWQVNVLNRGIGGTSLLCGSQKVPEPLVYRLCLTDKTLSLVPKEYEGLHHIELSLSNIRSCGSLRNYVFLEVGRSSSIGAGELWMDADDPNIAQNIHQTVFHAMKTSANSSKEDLDYQRPRSTSESSKQNAGLRRPKTTSFNQDTPHSNDSLANPVPTSSTTRTNAVNGLTGICQLFIQRATTRSSERRHSIAGGVMCPGIVSHQRTQSLPLAHPAPLTDHTSHPSRAAKRSNQSSKCYNSSGRERCDSMPSRPRTTSEGNHPVPYWNSLRIHQNQHRPHTMCIRDISYSPPSGSPISPPSANSTDSAGSSLSIDEPEAWNEGETLMGRYSNSLTPDEAIAEIDENPDSPMMHHSYSPNTYVPMNPISSDDGYVDMSPGGGRHNMSPAASVSSVTSGTPSTDMRFAEYHLEKVTSYLTPSEDETSSTDRPIRAYSVGSRSEYACCRTRPELTSTPENSRVRAFSVGSKSKKNHHNRVLPPHAIHTHHGAKSSSAPILSNSRLHNSWMNDHMELDFSKRNNLSNSGYVEMKPANRMNEGYVEMKPGRIPEVSPYVDMRGGSSPAKTSLLSLHHDNLPYIDGVPNNLAKVAPQDVARNDYVDMSGRNNKKTSPPSNRNHNTQSGYMDMNFHNRRNDNHLLSMVSPVRTTLPQGSPSNSMDYMEMDMHHSRVHENETQHDGYVEMTLGPKTNHQRQSSLESGNGNPDYANMNCGKKKERKTKTRSQPIAIQTTTASQGSLNSGSSPMYTPVGRKFSTGTPPKMFLPLTTANVSPFSSLPRQKSSNARRDSKDSSSSSLTTPSSSSTIFPISINSPSSPVQPQKTETPVTMKIPLSVINIKYNKSPPPPTTNEDYIMMDFDKNKKVDTSEYVNFNPAVKPAVAPIAKDEFDDYAIMKPGKVDAKPKPLGFRPISESKDDLATSPKPGDVAPDDPKPEDSQYVRSESVNSEKLARTRPGSTTSELGSSTSTIVGGTTSRPSSVNSERIRPASVSAEVQLHYASLDLAKAEQLEEGGGGGVGGGSRSPRALKPNEQGELTSTGFTYAEIDFIKSEQNARVKH